MKTINKLVPHLDWIGAIIALSAYFLLASSFFTTQDQGYWIMNLFPPVLIGASVYRKKAYGVLAMQFAWGAITIYRLVELNLV
ncbi:MAG: hypothetical protein R3B38_00260 [Patescibacteria group bacterium]